MSDALPSTPEEMWAKLDHLSEPEVFRVWEHSSPFMYAVKMSAAYHGKMFYSAMGFLTEPTPAKVAEVREEMCLSLKAKLWEAIHE